MMRLFPLLLLMPVSALAQGAPFCVVTGAGANCFYYNARSCRQAAQSMNGMCVTATPNQQAAPQHPSSFYEAWSRGEADARAHRHEQEEHEARMALLDAQAKRAAAMPAASYVQVHYSCPDGRGNSYDSYSAAPGCVVIEVIPVR